MFTTIAERGQMVLPTQTREKAGIWAGDRLALVTWSKRTVNEYTAGAEVFAVKPR